MGGTLEQASREGRRTDAGVAAESGRGLPGDARADEEARHRQHHGELPGRIRRRPTAGLSLPGVHANPGRGRPRRVRGHAGRLGQHAHGPNSHRPARLRFRSGPGHVTEPDRVLALHGHDQSFRAAGRRLPVPHPHAAQPRSAGLLCAVVPARRLPDHDVPHQRRPPADGHPSRQGGGQSGQRVRLPHATAGRSLRRHRQTVPRVGPLRMAPRHRVRRRSGTARGVRPSPGSGDRSGG